MSAQVFMPRVPGWALVASGACWLGLTALAVVLGEADGFPAKLGSQLASTAAGVAIGVTGVRALAQAWQRRRMRERTGPIVAEAIRDATGACGRMISYYTDASGTAFSGAAAVHGEGLATLLRPPLREDKTDLQPFRVWGREAFVRRTSLMEVLHGPVKPAPEDERFVARLRETLPDISVAEAELHRAVKVLVDFDAPHSAEVLEPSIAIRSALNEQAAAVNEGDSAKAAESCWAMCNKLITAALDMAEGMDLSWKETRRIAGRKQSPLMRASEKLWTDNGRFREAHHPDDTDSP
jgi:hypothetical protein